jgi:imidazolonepropionase-like amidohydrolase
MNVQYFWMSSNARMPVSAISSIFLIQCLVSFAFAQDATEYTLHGAKTARLDGGSLEFESKNVVIESGRISKLIDVDRSQDEHSGDAIDVTGLYLVPGLIDLHTHVTTRHIASDNFDEFLDNYDRQFKESLERRSIKATVAAQATLRAGVTAIRDLSTEGAGYLDVVLAKAIEDGIVVGPRVFPATLGVAATSGYMPYSADGRNTPQAAQTADTETELLEAVRQQHAHGAMWIKVFADFPKDPDSLPEPTYSREQLSIITAEARRLGMRVAAHAYTDSAARNCIAAGVDTIEHGFMVSEETMRLMRERDIVLIPTINAMLNEAVGSADDAFARGIAEKIIRSGVRFGVGSDAGGVVAHGSNVAEIFALVDLGFSTDDVLQAATSVGADVLGQAENLGQIEETYIADIVAYRKNPLNDIKTISNPVLVIKGGVVVLDARN